MPDETRPIPPRYKHLKRWLVIAALVIASVVTMRLVWGQRVQARLDAAVAAIEAKGEPIHFDDMRRIPVKGQRWLAGLPGLGD